MLRLSSLILSNLMQIGTIVATQTTADTQNIQLHTFRNATSSTSVAQLLMNIRFFIPFIFSSGREADSNRRLSRHSFTLV